MPIYDNECGECGNVFEVIAGYEDDHLVCPECGGASNRIIAAGGVNTANQDSAWLKSVVAIVDPESTVPHVKEFRDNPTRKNWQAWMKGEGIRPLENGENHTPYEKRMVDDRDDIRTREMWERHRERTRLKVGGY